MIGNIGLGELLVIMIISILVVGPKRTIEIARSLGRISRQLRDLSGEFTNALQAEIDATESQTGDIGAELRHVADELRGAFTGAEEEIEAVERGAAQMEADLGRVAREAQGTLAGARPKRASLPTGGPEGVEAPGVPAADDGREEVEEMAVPVPEDAAEAVGDAVAEAAGEAVAEDAAEAVAEAAAEAGADAAPSPAAEPGSEVR